MDLQEEHEAQETNDVGAQEELQYTLFSIVPALVYFPIETGHMNSICQSKVIMEMEGKKVQ